MLGRGRAGRGDLRLDVEAIDRRPLVRRRCAAARRRDGTRRSGGAGRGWLSSRAGGGLARGGELLARAAAAAVLELGGLLEHAGAHPRVRPGLPLEVDVDLVARLPPVELLDEVLLLLPLLLVDAAVVRLVPDDVRRQEDEQVRLRLRLHRVAEEPAEQREAAEDRDLLHAPQGPFLDEAADDDGVLVVGDDLRLHAALRGGRTEHGVGARDLLVLDVHLEPDVSALVDLRLDLEAQLDRLALDGRDERAEAARVEEVADVGGVRGVRPGEERGEARRRVPRLERDVLADDDLRLLVVGRDEVRRREDVHVRRRLQRLDDEPERREVQPERLRLRRDRARRTR